MTGVAAFIRRNRKALAGLVTPVVTFIVVNLLGASQEVAVTASALVTGFIVHRVKNVPG